MQSYIIVTVEFCGNFLVLILGEVSVLKKYRVHCRFNPFPNKPWFLRVCGTKLLKTLLEKEKLLVASNFSFSNNVFYSFGGLLAIFIKLEIVVCKLYQIGRVESLLFGKGLTHYQMTKF